ncbi:hypothetical protein PENTCL1PPCAC_29159, partial [Pristionchus entomophagus]
RLFSSIIVSLRHNFLQFKQHSTFLSPTMRTKKLNIPGRIDRLEELKETTSALLPSSDLLGGTFTEGVDFMLILAKNGPTDYRVTEALTEFRLRREQAAIDDKGKSKFLRQAGYAFCEAFELMVEAAIDWQAVKRESVMEEMRVYGRQEHSLNEADQTLEMRHEDLNEESSSEMVADYTNALEDLMPTETLKLELEDSDGIFTADFEDDKKDLADYRLIHSQPGPIEVDDIKQEVEDPIEDEQMASSSDNFQRIIISQLQSTTMQANLRNSRNFMAPNLAQSRTQNNVVIIRKRPTSHTMQASTSTTQPTQRAHLINLLDRAVQDTTNFMNPHAKKVQPPPVQSRRVPAILSRGNNRNHPVPSLPHPSMPANGASTSFVSEIKEVKDEPDNPERVFDPSIHDYPRHRSSPSLPTDYSPPPHIPSNPALQLIAAKTQALMQELNQQVNRKLDANLSSLAEKTRAELRKLGKEKAAKRREMDLLFKCTQCPMSFMSKNGLTSHIGSIHKIKKRIVGCDICQQPFEAGNSLKQHYLTVHPERKVACQICRVQLPGGDLKKHFLENHPDRTNEVFPDIRIAHTDQPNTLLDTHIYQYTCCYCLSKFPSKSKLSEHIETHVESYKAQHRKDNDANKAPLAVPGTIVKSEDPESSQTASTSDASVPSFPNKQASGVGAPSTATKQPPGAPCRCDECGLQFKDTFERAKHIIKTHKDFKKNSGKPHQCKLCERSFSCPSRLRDHEATHTGERPFKCPHCDAGFVTSSILKHHLRTDHTIPPHKCSMCKEKFFYVDELRKHMTEMH